jgi:glycosyltransferase involved in cell wall biosynthesis
MTPTLSLIIPTRERAGYLEHSIRTCMASSRADLEILVLDNASTDNTPQVVSAIRDSRLKYYRSESRLSMRDNFERGLELARGDVICYIGDDDGLMPRAVDQSLALFSQLDVDAVSAARAHYFWPDLLSARKNTALLPRASGVKVLNSREVLRKLLSDCDYYRLPCLYHGFVKRSVVERIKQKHDRFFLSSQVDIFSAIALSAEGIRYAFSKSPLVINGGSKRSNGASHFGGGGEKEKALWKIEDDLGFLSGFEGSLTVGSLIIESALRYCDANGISDLSELLDPSSVDRALFNEFRSRAVAGYSDDIAKILFETAKRPDTSSASHPSRGVTRVSRWVRLTQKYIQTRPIDMSSNNISNVYQAANILGALIASGHTGFLDGPLQQISAATRLARG